MGLFTRESRSRSGSVNTNPDNLDDVDEVDDGNKNIILAIIKQLRPGCDLSRITLPTFILERKSMLERITNIMQHPQLLLEAESTPDPVERFVKMVQWYMSGWYISPKAVKKPLNPVLGEYFTCYWDMGPENGMAYYVSEQTSHHPPKSSYFMDMPERNILIEGKLVPQSKFLGNSAASMMKGVGFCHFQNHGDETYRITQPNIYVRGILMGTMLVELGDEAVLECPQNNLRLVIEFKVKGFVGGEHDAVGGQIKQGDTALYELSGKWSDTVYIKDLKTGDKRVLFEVATDRHIPPDVRPLTEQGPTESRQLWHKVTRALGRRDHETATQEKYEVEEHQRRLRKEHEANNHSPQSRLFYPVSEELEYRFVGMDALRTADKEQHRAIISSIVPVLPGDQFPEDFDAPATEKRAAVQQAGQQPVQQESVQQQQPVQQEPVQQAQQPAQPVQPAQAHPAQHIIENTSERTVIDVGGDTEIFVDAVQS